MAKFKVLVAGEDLNARRELLHALEEAGAGFELLGEAGVSSGVLTVLKTAVCDVLFLDLSAPETEMLELVVAVHYLPRPPYVVVAANSGEYAVKAFESGVMDYLLKPFSSDRFKKTIERVTRACKERKTYETYGEVCQDSGIAAPRAGADLIPAELGGKMILVPQTQIIYAFSEKDNIYLKTFKNKALTRYTLKKLEARLSRSIFFRTHRCYLVNLYQVREIVPYFNGTFSLVVDDGENSEIPVSRAQAKKLRRILGF